MISRRRLALFALAAAAVCAAGIAAAVFFERFSSDLGGATVFWEGSAPSGGKMSRISCEKSGAALISKVYLVSTDVSRQINFRFACPGLDRIDGVRLYADGVEVSGRVATFMDRVMGVKCRSVRISLEAPGLEPLSGDIRLVVEEGESERFEVKVRVEG